MKKYDINKMLDEWGSSSIAPMNPYGSADGDPEDVEDLTSANGNAGAGIIDLTTNFPGPSDPENIPGPDKKPLQIKEADEIVPNSPKPKIKTQRDFTSSTNPSIMDGGNPNEMAETDPSMVGIDPMLGVPTGPSTSQEVGRVYELKKIYSRLVSMQSYLSSSTDVNLIKLRNYVSSTMDLFRTLISNIALYKDRIDEIIITFYKVVDNVYVILSKYYKDNTTGNDIMVKAIE